MGNRSIPRINISILVLYLELFSSRGYVEPIMARFTPNSMHHLGISVF